MDMHLISPILMVILLSLILILIYLYKTSELINKRKLLFVTITLILIYIVFNILYYHKDQPPKQKFKLTVFPLTENSNQNLGQKWLLQAIPEIIAKQLCRTVENQAIIAPIEWTYNIIKYDSLNSEDYLSDFCERIDFTHYFNGTLSRIDGKLVLHYKLQSINFTVIDDTVSFSIEQLLPTIVSITRKILGHFSFPDTNFIQPEYSKSLQALKYYMDGYGFFLNGNYTSGILKTSKAISIDSSFVEANKLMGQCYLASGINQRTKNKSDALQAFKKAKYFFNKAIENDSTNDEIYRHLGEYYIYHDRWSQAELVLNKAYKLNSNNPKVYISLSRLHKFRYQKLGFSEEEQLFKRAIFINPCYEKAYLMLSDLYLFQNKRKLAIESLNKFLFINPNSGPALMALSKIYTVRNEMSSAMDILNKVITLNPQNSDAYYNLGILAYNSKDFKKAKELFQRAIDIDNHLNSYLYLAYISELEGNQNDAINFLRKRVHFKTGTEDKFAEEARKHLFKLIQSDSTMRKEMEDRIHSRSINAKSSGL